MKKLLRIRWLTILVALALALIPAGSAMALPTADVTITATPEYLSMTNSEPTWVMNAVAEATTYWWTVGGAAPSPEPFEAEDMKSTVTNLGSVISDVKIHGHDFTAATLPWALDIDGSPGSDNVTIKWGITGTTNVAAMTFLTLSDVEIMDSLAATDGTEKWCMNLLTGTFTSGEAQTGIVTLTIFKHV